MMIIIMLMVMLRLMIGKIFMLMMVIATMPGTLVGAIVACSYQLRTCGCNSLLTASTLSMKLTDISPPPHKTTGMMLLGLGVQLSLRRAARLGCHTIGAAFVTRIGFWGPLYHNHNKEPPK